MKTKSIIRNTLGAFSDGAVLFPLLALLTTNAGFAGTTVLFTTGIAYITSALIFRVPMSVQPLKSIAVAAVTVGASFNEVRLSGLLLGIFLLFLVAVKADRLAKWVPSAVIHQLQAGLGVLLILQGLKASGDILFITTHIYGILLLAVAAVMVLVPEIKRIPVLGIVAFAGILWAVFNRGTSITIQAPLQNMGSDISEYTIRPFLVAGLLIPQIFLTLANSVLGTHEVCHRYFKEKASRVTLRKLLFTIGFGNVWVAIVGGMPFCHGSGGITAHVRGGSTRAWSTGLLGVFLTMLAAFQWIQGSRLISYPPTLITPLLITIGIFHMKLAAPTAQTQTGLLKLFTAVIVTLITRNLLWVVGFSILMELVEFCLVLVKQGRKKTEVL